jgi:predicted site-specific integrase-resolvase
LEISEKTLYRWLRDYKIKHNLEEAERGKKVDIPKKPSVKL